MNLVFWLLRYKRRNKGQVNPRDRYVFHTDTNGTSTIRGNFASGQLNRVPELSQPRTPGAITPRRLSISAW